VTASEAWIERAIGDGDGNGGRDLVVLPTSVMSVMFQCPAGWMAGMTSAFMGVVKNRVTMRIIMARMIGSGVVLVEKCRADCTQIFENMREWHQVSGSCDSVL
jgi:hypothetical protein